MDIKSFLDKASNAYYRGTPIISDEEFDCLAQANNYESIGEKGEVQHPYRMYSLQKFYSGETESPLKKEILIETPKLDGSAVSLIYAFGNLILILTRGDGKFGQDISHLIPYFPAPKKFKSEHCLVAVFGEVVAPKSMENSRNYASGALQLKDMEEFKTRNIEFFAYSIRPMRHTYTEDLNYLDSLGFNTVKNSDLSKFPQDGKVFRVDSNDSYKSLGFTASHPRGAYALKERKTGVVTKLKDVIWQVGRSGVVSPVAVLEPISIDGATVQKATLHNMQYITALGLEIGCNVEVVRSGDIIPRVVRKVETH